MVGVYGLKVFKNFFEFTNGNHLYIPILVIGIVMTVVGILSLWFTPKGLSWMLYIYGVIVFALFLVIFFMSILFMVKRKPIENELKLSIERSIQIYNETGQPKPIDLIQKNFRCCGSMSYTDWFKSPWSNNQKIVPQSCCIKTNCTNTLTDQIYTQGCSSLLDDIIENNYALIGGIGFGSAILILAGSLLSCALASHLRKYRYEQM